MKHIWKMRRMMWTIVISVTDLVSKYSHCDKAHYLKKKNNNNREGKSEF